MSSSKKLLPYVGEACSIILSATRLPYPEGELYDCERARSEDKHVRARARAFCRIRVACAPVAAQGRDAASELIEDGFQHERRAVFNDALQYEICMRGAVQIFDGACAKQNAQHLCVMRRSVFPNHCLQSSAPSAVEGRPHDPWCVQVDQFSVQDFPSTRRRSAVDLVAPAHCERARGGDG